MPAWLAAEGLTGRFYPRLMSRFAPVNTIITHCTLSPQPAMAQSAKQKDIVVRLNGKTEKVNVGADVNTGYHRVSPLGGQK